MQGFKIFSFCVPFLKLLEYIILQNKLRMMKKEGSHNSEKQHHPRKGTEGTCLGSS